MVTIAFDIDFKFIDYTKYKPILQNLIKEGWEIEPPINSINGSNYTSLDIVACYAVRKLTV